MPTRQTRNCIRVPIMVAVFLALVGFPAIAQDTFTPQEQIVLRGSFAREKPDQDSDVTTPGYEIREKRLAGDDRYGTAVAVSKELYNDNSATNVLIASGDDFPDAITGLNFSDKGKGTPILLSTKVGLQPTTVAELKRIAAPNAVVTVIGGERAVMNSTIKQIADLGFNVRRIGGGNRAETALNLADFASTGSENEAVVSPAEDFATSIVAAVFASHIGAPLLITFSDDQHSQTDADSWLRAKGVSLVYAFGTKTANHITLPTKTITGSGSQEIFVDITACYPRQECILPAMLAPRAMPGQQIAEYIWQHHYRSASDFVVINGEQPVDGIAAGQLAVVMDLPILTTFSTGGNPHEAGGTEPVVFRYPNLMMREGPRNRTFYFVGGPITLSEETVKVFTNSL